VLRPERRVVQVLVELPRPVVPLPLRGAAQPAPGEVGRAAGSDARPVVLAGLERHERLIPAVHGPDVRGARHRESPTLARYGPFRYSMLSITSGIRPFTSR